MGMLYKMAMLLVRSISVPGTVVWQRDVRVTERATETTKADWQKCEKESGMFQHVAMAQHVGLPPLKFLVDAPPPFVAHPNRMTFVREVQTRLDCLSIVNQQLLILFIHVLIDTQNGLSIGPGNCSKPQMSEVNLDCQLVCSFLKEMVTVRPTACSVSQESMSATSNASLKICCLLLVALGRHCCKRYW